MRVQPRARRTTLQFANGMLKAYVPQPPEDGRANDAVLALLADTWRLPRSSFTVIKGVASRQKTVRVSGDADSIADSIADWMKADG